MDRLREFLEIIKDRGTTNGRFRGFLHVLVGKKIQGAEGVVICQGMTWREAAALLKKCRWDRQAVLELGLNLADLPPRDREKFWYTAIARANLGSPQAITEASEFARDLANLGYTIASPSPRETPAPEAPKDAG